MRKHDDPQRDTVAGGATAPGPTEAELTESLAQYCRLVTAVGRHTLTSTEVQTLLDLSHEASGDAGTRAPVLADLGTAPSTVAAEPDLLALVPLPHDGAHRESRRLAAFV